jgi:hypothetical protein
MRLWLFLLGSALLATTACPARAAGRFSETLSETDWKACGLDGLSSDQVAALDALVHRVTDAAKDEAAATLSQPFSQQLIPDEFGAAGLGRLSAAQLAQLNAQVGAILAQGGPPALTALAPPRSSPPIQTEREPTASDLHGFVALTYGFGGGTSLREAKTALDYGDPTHPLEIGVSYSQLEGKRPYACGSRLP